MPDTTTRAREIRAELDKLAPCPEGDAVTAIALGRYLARCAQEAWARMTGMSHPVAMTDIAIPQGNFAAACALIGWAENDTTRDDASEVAVQIREAFNPPGIAEWLYELLDDDAKAIARLAGELAEVTAPAGADEVARLKAELSRVQSAARTLGRVITRLSQSMEAARIEMIQNGPEVAMQWILNSLPDVSDDAPGDQWDGKETATQWIDRTQAAERAVKP